ncbi:gliding motility-associated C-terminal domain-containing protein [Fluviicola taffensis]|uniref:PKD domain containing protein n=1 Tax=Fluviicola taffensis (strain DSM 16823 / NCIMB 13979 / RW262) TaxID=755732 RepID=F2II52_FLUTR|nr:gliding motility-associated C-terminal domain-containing protein [Fluviicola taffensis]AEA42752.1 PKD domain containing protein [Fluviicola taffensis DSM 16823]
MKVLLYFLLLFCSIGASAQMAVNCNLAIPGCSNPDFDITGAQPPYNTPDFGSGTISNPSTNPQGVNSGCLLSGETVSTFITINIVTSGTLEWSIIGLNSGTTTPSNSGCFDWIMWADSPSSTTDGCAGINGNTLPPVACNWNGMCNGNTGMSAPGNYPPGASNTSYQPPLTVTAGQTIILCLSNYSSVGQDINFNFFGTASVVCGVSAADQTICLGNSASVTIATPGYTAPSFNWLVTTGVTNPSAGTTTVNPTVTTTYSVVVSQPPMGGNPALQDTATFTITVVNPPAPNAGPNQTVCLGQPILLTGSVGSTSNTANWQAIVPPGLTPAATASFSPNSSSMNPTVTVNQPGIYKFVLRETSTLCGIVRDTVFVTVSQLQLASAVTNPSCFGFSDGTITITSVGASEYSFNNGVTWQASNTLGGFAAGTYNVCARNTLGCQKCTTAILTNPAEIVMSVSNDTVICQNGTATIWANAIGGATSTSGYSYHWDHNPSLLASTQINPTIDAYYPVQAQSNLGCWSNKDSIYVTLNPVLTGVLSVDAFTCPGYEDSLTVTASGGIGAPYTMTWSTGQTDVGTESTMNDSPLITTTYTVTIDDVCETTPITLTGQIIAYSVPIPQISIDMTPKCEPAVFVLKNTTDPNMSQNTIWRITNGDEFIDVDSLNTSSTMNGTYDVQLIVTSPDGCIDSTTFTDTLVVMQTPVADFKWSPDPITMFNTQVLFTEYSLYANTYEWSFPGASPNSSTNNDQTVLYPDGQTGTYYVTLIAKSYLGCADTVTKKVVILPEVILYAPNTFTPDGDEFNQTWRIHIEGIDEFDFELQVFNRWGEMVWESHDVNASWDGTYNGQLIQQGTYTWLIRTREIISDKKYTWNGTVNIIK